MTSIVIQSRSGPETSTLAARFSALMPADIRVCAVVVAELRHGCLRSAKPAANRTAVDALLAPSVSLPFDDVAADRYATIRHHLETVGATARFRGGAHTDSE